MLILVGFTHVAEALMILLSLLEFHLLFLDLIVWHDDVIQLAVLGHVALFLLKISPEFQVSHVRRLYRYVLLPDLIHHLVALLSRAHFSNGTRYSFYEESIVQIRRRLDVISSLGCLCVLAIVVILFVSMLNFLNLSVFIAKRTFLPLVKIGVVGYALDLRYLVNRINAMAVNSFVVSDFIPDLARLAYLLHFEIINVLTKVSLS